MSSLKFGTSGLRGLVVDLVGWPSYAHTLAFLRSVGAPSDKSTPVLIGRDLRSSSPEIASTVAAAALTVRLHPLDCGPLPTPALALEALRRRAPAIMVTGSHIPDDRNGLKFYLATGEITKADEAAILAAVPASGSAPPPHTAERSEDAMARYKARNVNAFRAGMLAGMRIGIYQHSTVARDLLVAVISSLGAKAVSFGRSDLFVPVDTEAHRSEDLEALRSAATAERLDAIVSADGDADRPLLADATGQVVRGDVLGLIAARYLGIKAIAVPVTAASALERTGGFTRIIRTRVGSPFVIQGMEQARQEGHATVAGFEANGGFLLGSNLDVNGLTIEALPTRDAMLPILAALAAARSAGCTIAELVARVGAGAAASDRLKEVPPELSARFLVDLENEAFRTTFVAPLGRATSLDRLDGFRMAFGDGAILHFRSSGNAPELRCYAEAANPAEAARLVAWGLDAAAFAMGIHDYGGRRPGS